MTSESKRLQAMYAHRFENDEQQRQALWDVLCTEFFQRWVPRDSTVLDLAAGSCEFVNNISAERRVAVDLNPDVVEHAGPGVETHVCPSDRLDPIGNSSIDRVFISNFFEHVTRQVILSTLAEVVRVLKPDGKLLVLQPNVRYCSRNYWMFFDHVTPVDDRALAEAFNASGIELELDISRFLPYTTKGRLPSSPGLVRLYLRAPLAWRVIGAQAFLVGHPSPCAED